VAPTAMMVIPAAWSDWEAPKSPWRNRASDMGRSTLGGTTMMTRKVAKIKARDKGSAKKAGKRYACFLSLGMTSAVMLPNDQWREEEKRRRKKKKKKREVVGFWRKIEKIVIDRPEFLTLRDVRWPSSR